MNPSQLSLMTFPLDLDFALRTMSVADSLRLARQAGIPSLDVMQVPASAVPVYRSAMEQTGVEVYCYISTTSLFQRQQAIQARLERDMSVASALGAKLFMIVPYYPVVDPARARAWGREGVLYRLAEGFRLAVALGQQYGLIVCFETTPQADIRLSAAADCRWLLEQVPDLGLVFDTANILPAGEEPLAACRELMDAIVHVHLKDVALEPPHWSLLPQERTAEGDVMRCVPWGEGVIPIQAIETLLHRSGYRGKLALEYARPSAAPCGLAAHAMQLERYLANLRS